MNTRPLLKVVKKAQRETPEIQPEANFSSTRTDGQQQFARGLVNINRIGAANHFRPSTVCSRTHSIVGFARPNEGRSLAFNLQTRQL
jgi:hypothetical protein